MRIWTIHPRYLDTKGLVAVWREGLLAQKVLQNATRGYRNHPQLVRFKTSPNPVTAIATYLRAVHIEAVRRGYEFNEHKISPGIFSGTISCTRGQLLYEWHHLKGKLRSRDVRRYLEVETVSEPDPHPVFSIVAGDIEPWEILNVA